MKFLGKKIKYLSILLFVPCVAIGQTIPDISGIVADGDSVNVADGVSVTITGESFGDNGPNVVLFDNLERGANGQSMNSSANIGTWAASSGEFISDDVGANMAGRWIIGGYRYGQSFSIAPATTEVFTSFRVKVPDGKWFPCASAEESMDVPVQPVKLLWLYDSASGNAGIDDDWAMWILLWPAVWMVDGNDRPVGSSSLRNGTDLTVGSPESWWSWDNWNRCSTYLKGGAPDPKANNGIVWGQAMSEEKGQVVGSRTGILFDGDDNASDNDIDQWDWINFNAMVHTGHEHPNQEVWFDDIYMAVGDHARARVEIGNNINYASCTKLEISTPTSWSDTSISVVVRLSEFSGNDEAYLFVIDENGQASEGFEITIGAGVSEGRGQPTGAGISGGG